MRVARTGVHLLWGSATVALFFPVLGLRARRALKARWSRQLLDVLGVRLCVTGRPPDGGLVVANHVSWLDIYALNACTPVAFVAKDDVRAWPLIGWLCLHTETLFLERGSRNAAVRAKEHIAAELRRGTCVGVFPEGTTSGGDRVLPFHGALFQSAVDAGARVTPVALGYGAGGERSQAPAYTGDTSLWQSLCAVAGARGLTAHLCFLPPLEATGADRRQLAQRTHQAIADRLPRVAAAADGAPAESAAGILALARR